VRTAQRLLLAFLMLVQAVPVDASRLMVLVRDDGDNSNRRAMNSQIPRLLPWLGIDYDILGPGVGKTEWPRVGVATFGTGPGATTQAYSACLILGTGIQSAKPPGIFRQDSMTRSVTVSSIIKMPTIPTIRIAEAGMGLQSTTDSTGCDGSQATHFKPEDGDLYVPGTGIRWGGVGGRTGSPDYNATGGLRTLLGWGTTDRTLYIGTNTAPIPPAWGDSLVAQATRPESASVWVKWNTHVAGAAHQIYVSDADNYAQISEWTQYVLALAYADSLVGGTLIKRPIKLGICVRGGWRRNSAVNEGGMVTADSAAFIATMDSLATLGVPITVGVNLDSLENYTRDKVWWARAGKVSYAPENWASLDTTKLSRGASWQNPCDLFGAKRKRIAFGDGSTTDTSIAGLTRAAFWKLDSAFGRGNVDRVLIPPGSIWDPLLSTANSRDSVVSAFASGGARGIVLNASWNGGASSSRQRFVNSGTVPIRFGAAAGSRFKLLMTPGWTDSGAASAWGPLGEGLRSTGATGDILPFNHHVSDNFGRSWMGVNPFYQGGSTNNNDASSNDSLNVGPCFVYTVHAGDFGGGGFSPNPSRPGYQQIKMLWMMAKAINNFAYAYPDGRRKQIIVFTKLQDLDNQ
jgi:hypothetical protein